MNSPPIFVTGAARSGTTLLDKLLSVPNKSRIFSQPLPLLFSSIKAQFQLKIGAPNSYPLNDMFMTNYYEPTIWHRFLNDHSINTLDLTGIFFRMAKFSGQLTKPTNINSFIDGYTPSNLEGFLIEYISWLSNNTHITLGLKEIWCEEYLPFFLSRGFKCIQILRDPRDLITSLDFGSGPSYTGQSKPLLYNIRTWRKSVAVALSIAEHPRYRLVKYEDLVSQPDKVIPELFKFLSLGNIDVERAFLQMTDHNGLPWQSNSSHGGTSRISQQSVGKYRDVLSPAIRTAIEALCLPEMTSLGYPSNLSLNKLEETISKLSFDEESKREELGGYLWGPDRKVEELHRARLFRNNDYRPEYFLFNKSFRTLRQNFT